MASVDESLRLTFSLALSTTRGSDTWCQTNFRYGGKGYVFTDLRLECSIVRPNPILAEASSYTTCTMNIV